MSRRKIDQDLCGELLQFLDQEHAFLVRVEKCASTIAEQPVGRSFSTQLIDEIAGLQHDTGLHNLERAKLKSRLCKQLLKTPAALRLSQIDAGPKLTQQIQTRRRQVLEKANSVDSLLRTVLGLLRESNVIVAAVLESVLGVTVDPARYDSEGRLVQHVGHVEAKSVG